MDRDLTQVASNLRKARALLDRPGGYIKGARSNGEGGYCALGALDAVLKRRTEECAPEVLALSSTIPADWWDTKRGADGNVRDPYNGTVAGKEFGSGKDWDMSRVACYNNLTDQKTVVEWFDRAIRIQTEHPMENATDA